MMNQDELLKEKVEEAFRLSCFMYDEQTGRCTYKDMVRECDCKCGAMRRFKRILDKQLSRPNDAQSEKKEKLHELLDELRGCYDELHDDIEWAGMTDSYPKASAVYRAMERLARAIKDL